MLKKILKNTDFILFVLMIILVVIGCIGIYSANYSSGDTEYLKQIMWFLIGLVFLIGAWLIDYRTLGIIGYVAYIISVILLIAVLFTPKLNGASSWFNIGNFFLFQPSELMKIAYVLVVRKVS